MLKSSRLFITLALMFLVLSGESFAQRFGGGVSLPERQNQEMPSQPARATQPRATTFQKPVAKTQNFTPQPIAQEEEEDDESTNSSPTTFQIKFVGNEVFVDSKPRILLYMRDFKISRDLKGMVNCDMRFYVLSNISEKITNISYRLKWPNIETALSFDDVAPNTAVYYDYSLLGNGCYGMDKAPNITVNRCRVKGMSQQDCAMAIQWLN